MRGPRARGLILCLVCAVAQFALPSPAQTGPHDAAPLKGAAAVSPLPNGVTLHRGPLIMQVVALRADVLRVRVSPSGKLPEDASWAVSTAVRSGSVPVTQDIAGNSVGFHTDLLRVSIDRTTLALTVLDKDGRVLQQDAQPIRFDGHAFRIAKKMPADEHYFGLGDKTGPLDRRNLAFTLWNTDAYRFQESTDPLYKSIPYFMTYRAGTAVGVLLDNTWRSSFDFGKESPGSYSFGAVDGPIDYYIFPGPTPRQVVETYAWLTGAPPLPPLWMLGFQQSRYTYTPQSRLLEIADRLRADHIPADALYLDIEFQQKNRPFTVDTAAFPDFKAMIDKLRASNFHLVVIADLHVAKAPDQSYAPYDSGIAGDHFVHRPDGSVYSGAVWPGPSVFPDFTRQQTRTWWGTLYRQFVADGVSGFWNDMNEPSVFDSPTKTIPEDVLHRIDEPGFRPRAATHAEIHNILGMENSRATFDGLRTLQPGVRPFVLTRAAYAGTQRYAATWTGDDSSTWNHLRMTTPMLKNLGLSGFSFAGADVGGFAGSAPDGLLTKWLEVAAFHPIDRAHSEKGTADKEPWIGGPEQESIRRRFIEERYRLMPYLYTLAEETAHTGLPMMRPLFLDYPQAATDGHPIDVDPESGMEFLLGHDLLIAPPPYPDQPDVYPVEFPTALWYDYWTGQPVPNPPHAASNPELPPNDLDRIPLSTWVRPELASLPVYVRGGAILPIAPLVQSTDETPQGPLTLRVFPGPDCRGDLYLDDGKSYAYQHGAFLRMHFACETTADGLKLHVSPHEGSYPAWWTSVRIEVCGWKPKQNTAESSSQPTQIAPLPEKNGVTLTLPDTGKGLEIVLH